MTSPLHARVRNGEGAQRELCGARQTARNWVTYRDQPGMNRMIRGWSLAILHTSNRRHMTRREAWAIPMKRRLKIGSLQYQ